MILYGYWRSSAAYRVRIALNLKKLDCELIPVHLVNDGGQQHHAQYGDLNPSHLVPTLVDNEVILNQSLAIIEYLDNKSEQTKLYPSDIRLRAIAQSLALDIACEIHPLNNLRVQQFLSSEFQLNDQDKLTWSRHWIKLGFNALETRLQQSAGNYCVGNTVTVADLCLVPQVYNANRCGVDMTPYPIIRNIVAHCNQQPAFISAMPENQSDAQ